MKYLLVLVVVMVAVWVWRSNRAEERADEQVASRRRQRPAVASAVDMVGCDLCGVHCPSDDLVRGRNGVYCCTQHRDQAEA